MISFGAVRKLDLRTGVMAVISILLFGVAIECVQYPIPNRTFNPIDIFANAYGVIFGSLLWIPINLGSRIHNRMEPPE